jgi:DNA-directed RNA polymerase specialized sigma24 family protein
MTTSLNERRQELLALEPRLRDCADALTRDADESRALVLETLRIARDPECGESGDPKVWIFRLLRQRFYSVERDRDYRRSRSAAVTELGYARKRALAAQAAADVSDAI